MRETYQVLALALMALTWPVSLVNVHQDPDTYVPWFAPTVLGLLGALVALGAILVLRHRDAVAPIAAIVAVSYLALAAHPWVVVVPAEHPPLLDVIGAGMMITAVASVRVAWVAVPLFAIGVALVRAPQIGIGQGVAEAFVLSLAGYFAAIGITVFDRASCEADVAVRQAWRAREARARVAGRAQAREQWDAFIHDTVLAALSIAARSTTTEVPEPARDLAGQALAALTGVSQRPATLEDACRERAERLGVALTWSVRGQLDDPEVRAAFAGAINEALTNVARHSGEQHAVVSGSLTADRAQVQVADSGRGFDRTQALGVGLTTSVLTRMRAVGGDAQVSSQTGRGTQVVLTWEAGNEGNDPSAGEWLLRAFTPMYVLGWAVLLVAVAASSEVWLVSPSRGLAIAEMGAIVAVTAASMLVQPTKAWGRGLASAIVVIAAVGALNTPVVAADGRYWYLNALLPSISALAYRLEGQPGPAAAIGAVASVAAVDLLLGRPVWGCLLQSAPVLLAVMATGRAARRRLSATWDAIEESTRENAELRLALAAEAERRGETQARRQALGDLVRSDLERLSAGTVRAADRRRIGLVAAAIRDQLAAPGLVDPELAAGLDGARRRGVVVDIVPAPSWSGAQEPCQWCRQVVATVLEMAAPEVQVRVSWRPDDQQRLTIAAVGPQVAAVAAGAREKVDAVGDVVEVSLDDDAVLVEIAHCPTVDDRTPQA